MGIHAKGEGGINTTQYHVATKLTVENLQSILNDVAHNEHEIVAITESQTNGFTVIIKIP